ncbi:MAG: prolyl oligopeptidase family serine peptidase, partial [Methylococcales bacterium]
RAAERGAKPYRCAVSYAGVSDLKVMRRYDGQFLNGRFATEWLREQAPDLDAVSPIKRPQNFAIPILLIHGKKDRRVPYKQSASLAEKLQKAGKSVRYVEQPLGDHHFTREADRIEFLTELEKFLDAQNPADSPITTAAAASGG